MIIKAANAPCASSPLPRATISWYARTAAPLSPRLLSKNAGCLFADRHAPGFEWKPAPGECPAAEPQAPGAAPIRPRSPVRPAGPRILSPACSARPAAHRCTRAPPRYDPTTAERSPAAYGPASVPPADPFHMDAVPPEFRVRPDEGNRRHQSARLGGLSGQNAAYYLLNFKRISATGRKMSLCFSAFLFGPLYFFYRKMWAPAVAYLAMDAVTYLPAILNLMLYAENPLAAGLNGQALSALSMTGSVLYWILKFLAGSFAIWIYKNTAAKRIRAALDARPACGPAPGQSRRHQHGGPGSQCCFPVCGHVRRGRVCRLAHFGHPDGSGGHLGVETAPLHFKEPFHRNAA